VLSALRCHLKRHNPSRTLSSQPGIGGRQAEGLVKEVHFDQIVPWGRSRREYELMFRLTSQDLSGGVLDYGGGLPV
jgi:hypothetical protein